MLTAMTPCVVSSEATARSSQTHPVVSSLMVLARSPFFLIKEAAPSWTTCGMAPTESGWKFRSNVARKKTVCFPSVPER